MRAFLLLTCLLSRASAQADLGLTQEPSDSASRDAHKLDLVANDCEACMSEGDHSDSKCGGPLRTVVDEMNDKDRLSFLTFIMGKAFQQAAHIRQVDLSCDAELSDKECLLLLDEGFNALDSSDAGNLLVGACTALQHYSAFAVAPDMADGAPTDSEVSSTLQTTGASVLFVGGLAAGLLAVAIRRYRRQAVDEYAFVPAEPRDLVIGAWDGLPA